MFFMEYFIYYLQVNKIIVLCNFCHNSAYFKSCNCHKSLKHMKNTAFYDLVPYSWAPNSLTFWRKMLPSSLKMRVIFLLNTSKHLQEHKIKKLSTLKLYLLLWHHYLYCREFISTKTLNLLQSYTILEVFSEDSAYTHCRECLLNKCVELAC